MTRPFSARREAPARRILGALLSGVVLVVLATRHVHAHPALEARIAELTRLIAAQPGNARLLVERAGVQREHQDWASARTDLEAARRIDPHLDGLDLAFGLLLADQGDARGALPFLDAAVASRPTDVDALVTRARCLGATGEPERAAGDLGRAIATTTPPARPQPDLYVQRAHLLLSVGPDLAHAQAALATLDEGIARLGPVLTLVLPAIATEVRLGHFDAALTRLDGARMATAEALVTRGEILAAAGRLDESHAALTSARAELDREGRRPTPLDTGLRLRITKASASLVPHVNVTPGHAP